MKKFQLNMMVCIVVMLIFSFQHLGHALNKVTLKIGENIFHAELANTDEKRQKGLMFRHHLDKKTGMLFDFQKSVHVAMWMKNTYIPLDMIFIDEKKKIIKIVSNNQPYSLKQIHSSLPVRYVLEINGGESKKYQLMKGHKVDGLL